MVGGFSSFAFCGGNTCLIDEGAGEASGTRMLKSHEDDLGPIVYTDREGRECFAYGFTHPSGGDRSITLLAILPSAWRHKDRAIVLFEVPHGGKGTPKSWRFLEETDPPKLQLRFAA